MRSCAPSRQADQHAPSGHPLVRGPQLSEVLTHIPQKTGSSPREIGPEHISVCTRQATLPHSSAQERRAPASSCLQPQPAFTKGTSPPISKSVCAEISSSLPGFLKGVCRSHHFFRKSYKTHRLISQLWK